MGFVGDDDDVGTIGEFWVSFARYGTELLDQGEEVAVIFLEEVF